MAARIPGAHFHYLTVPPQFLSRRYREFLQRFYPDGSLDTRSTELGNAKSLFHARQYYLRRIFQTYPMRKFILIGDNANKLVHQILFTLSLNLTNPLQRPYEALPGNAEAPF